MIKRETVVLFDVDGTLVLTGRAGVRGMDAAFASLYGRTGALEAVPIAGRTDRAIVSDVLTTLAVEPTDDEIARLRDTYFRYLRVEITAPSSSPKHVLPGVHRLLDALGERSHVAVGLLTGNFEGGAAIKLGHFGLWQRFAFGAFGDRHTNRRDLVPLALGEAGRRGVRTPNDRVIVIGDTPLDVDCARAHGVRSLAVATGPFPRAELEAAGADLAVETLGDVAALVDWLDGGA